MKRSVEYVARVPIPPLLATERESFWVEAVGTSSGIESMPYEVPLRDIPAVFRRVMFQASPHIMFAAFPDLSNKIRVTVFSASGGKKLIEAALCEMKQKLAFGVDFEVHGDNNWEEDEVILRMAIDTHTKCYLENLGFLFLRTKTDGEILTYGTTTASFAVCNLTLETQISFSTPPFMSLQPASKNAKCGSHAKAITVAVNGEAQILSFKELSETLSKEELRKYNETGCVRLDSVPCAVLPSCAIAYAVEYSSLVPKELKSYWEYVHGISFVSIRGIFRVTFTPGNEDACLTYPAQCVLQPHGFLQKPLRDNHDMLDKEMAKLTSSLKLMSQAM